MKLLLTTLLLTITCNNLVAVEQRFPYSESKFLREFRTLKAINSLLTGNAEGKLDGILAFGPGEGFVARKGMVVLHRSFEVEISEISNTDRLIENMETSLKKKMRASGLTVKVAYKLGQEGFTLQYESECVAGFTDVRAIWEGDTYHVYFVFNETFCRVRSVSK